MVMISSSLAAERDQAKFDFSSLCWKAVESFRSSSVSPRSQQKQNCLLISFQTVKFFRDARKSLQT